LIGLFIFCGLKIIDKLTTQKTINEWEVEMGYQLCALRLRNDTRPPSLREGASRRGNPAATSQKIASLKTYASGLLRCRSQ
jgi:hypothetical protein